jgi:hypothetical protein
MAKSGACELIIKKIEPQRRGGAEFITCYAFGEAKT